MTTTNNCRVSFIHFNFAFTTEQAFRYTYIYKRNKILEGMDSFPAHRPLSRRTRSLLPLAGQLFQPTNCDPRVEQKIKR